LYSAPAISLLLLLLLLAWCYNSGSVLAFSTISFHLRRSWTCSVHFMSFIFFTSFRTLSSHQDLGLPTGLPVNGFHLCIFFTILVSGILFMSPNQLKRQVLVPRSNERETGMAHSLHRDAKKFVRGLHWKL